MRVSLAAAANQKPPLPTQPKLKAKWVEPKELIEAVYANKSADGGCGIRPSRDCGTI